MIDTAEPIQPPSRPARRGLWLFAVVALIVVFIANALLAVRGKSSTFDEPVHTLSSWQIVNDGEFRVNPEHPALWKYVAGLALLGQPLKVDYDSPGGQAVLDRIEGQWWWTAETLYGDRNAAPLYGERLVARARVTMTIFSVLLAIVLTRWAWVWGGPVAAVIAVAMLTFDPNFLAHGALVTNDIAATFLIALATYLTWRLGERFTWPRACAFAIACAAGLGIKFTCLLLAPMLGIPLLYRAWSASPWPAGNGAALRSFHSRLSRTAVVFGVCVASLLTGWAMLWPTYQFREAPTATGQRFDDRYVRDLLAYYAMIYERRNNADLETRKDARLKADVPAWQPGALNAAMLWMNNKHFTPQAWSWGINYANARSYKRSSILLGEFSEHGFWSFFPLAIAFKSPVMTLTLAVLAVIVGLRLALKRISDSAVRWKLVCLFVPPAIYFAAAMSSTLNIGLRHILPVYIPVFVACAVTMAHVIKRWQPARKLVPAALGLLAIETTSVFPNYLTFFNLPSGGGRGGIELLSDSNLDWGQDLPALADWYRPWRAANPHANFYLAYYGSADPRAYGIDYINAQPGYPFDARKPTLDLESGVYAVSASYLQGIFPEEMRASMWNLLHKGPPPLAVINDSIYIYPVQPNPSPSTRPAS